MGHSINESYDYLFKLLCIGDSNVGKTTFLHKYIYETFSNIRSTLGINIFEKYITVKDNQRVLLQLWDTVGQERYHSLTTSLYRDSMGFLLIFDLTNESSFLSIRNWISCIDSFALIDGDLRPPILLIGNKVDLSTHRKIDSIRAQQFADEFHIAYIEICALTGINIQYALDTLTDKIFNFMDESMKKYYQKQPLQLSTNENYRHRKISIKLMKNISNVKKRFHALTKRL
ncbi:unnamed protein product [Rotaria socialis]|uniref:Uncharacterized protein n=1 Tax=Rotaria socialis TaxID=392032 RepID=A0A817X3U5_9BILA|nr:unnamed protein product [Rotaria socialis]